ncbi:hypothetical protein [Neokomagataea thailandica]|uniref:hypothetical protein n=1 Tax=Neokomagataea TaxID=1223423 RepID=UPI0008360718|nr:MULTISPECIES: hypothetical protein [Neokomagataea]
MTALWRPILLACIVLGLGGQLTLQSHALPDEAPRITLERLTGLHIGPAAQAMDAHCTAMMQMRTDHTPEHAHHHGIPCPLCPLLHLPVIILGLAIIALLIARLRLPTRYTPHPSHLIPAQRASFLPPSTGPPTFA